MFGLLQITSCCSVVHGRSLITNPDFHVPGQIPCMSSSECPFNQCCRNTAGNLVNGEEWEFFLGPITGIICQTFLFFSAYLPVLDFYINIYLFILKTVTISRILDVEDSDSRQDVIVLVKF